MGAERLPMRRVRDVLRLKYEAGLSHRKIARALGMGVGTVSEYLERARRAGLRWPVPAELDDAALEARVFPAAPVNRERVLPDLAEVHQELKGVGVTLHLLWEEYRQVHGEGGYGYSQYCELYRRWAGRLQPKLKVSRRQLWERVDRPALKALPASRYEAGEWSPCRVNIDYHVEVARHLYSVPYQLVGQLLEARYTRTIVEIYYKGRRLESYPRRYDRGATTRAEHMPSSHRAHAEWTPSRLVHWAEKTGPACGRTVTGILKSRPHPEQGYRACLGLMRLGKCYGAARLEAACERAEHLRSYSYRTVMNILAPSHDRLPLSEEAHEAATAAHDNIRGGSYYTAPAKQEKC
jgi:transposase